MRLSFAVAGIFPVGEDTADRGIAYFDNPRLVGTVDIGATEGRLALFPDIHRALLTHPLAADPFQDPMLFALAGARPDAKLQNLPHETGVDSAQEEFHPPRQDKLVQIRHAPYAVARVRPLQVTVEKALDPNQSMKSCPVGLMVG